MITFARAREILAAGIAARVFPGAVAHIGRQAGTVETLAVGHLTYEAGAPPVRPDTIFDLASLTKVLAGATLTLGLVDSGRIAPDDLVRSWLQGWDADDRRDVTVRDLLEHSSGLPAYRPYYLHAHGRPAFEAAIMREPLVYPPRASSLYSDVGFMLVGFILEDAGGAPLSTQFDTWRAVLPGRSEAMRYGPVPPDDVAPTEHDRWRGRMLQGEVHDENAAALDGIAAHAGLFGPADAVAAAARWWMQALSGGVPSISPMSAHRFTSPSAVPGSSRALGWDTMRTSSSCGTRMSARAFGHTGYTGTSLWIDPAQDLYVVLLTNRVHPTREGVGIRDVRRAFHDAVVAAIDAQ
ncbi:MAG: serine hydrolase domain-containing protein [Vicinamibacterales bacterium]